MKNKFVRFALACLLAVVGINAFAFNKSMYPYTLPAGAQGAALGCEKAVAGQKLELGKWYTNFTVCKDYADKNGIPLFAVWSNHSCIHCWYTDIVFVQDAFKEWQKTHDAGKVILCYMAGGDDTIDQANSTAYNWMWNNRSLGAYPFVALWWKAGNVNIHLTGDELCRGSASANLSFTDTTIPTRVANVTAYMEKAFKGWTATPPYDGGLFSLTNKADPLQAESTTTTLYVPVYRTGKVATNQTMKVTRGTITGTQTVTWAANVTNQVVAIPSFSKWYAKNTTVTLEFADASGVDKAKTTVKCVADMANGPSNPYWIGERTAETLNAGDWTMDLDVALARTKAQSGEAYTLVQFTGALWCPWCRGCENDVLNTDAFKQFAKDKNISLVCLDNPRRSRDLDVYGTNTTTQSVSSGPYGAGPTLLRYDEGSVASATTSGVSYVSRKMVKSADAEKILQRNHDLGYIGGTYATPDAYRTGYPTLVLLDKSGAVVGRLNYQADSETDDEGRHPFDLAENMTRLTNLVETASAENEANRYATTTKLTQSVGLPASVTLGLNTPSQTLKLDNVPAGTVDFAVAQTRAAAPAVTLQLLRLESYTLQRKNAAKKAVKSETIKMPVVVATGTGSLKHEFTSVDTTAEYFLSVGLADGSTLTEPLTLDVSSAPVLTAKDGVAVYTPVSDTIKFEVEKGAVYKFGGAWKDLTTVFTQNEDGTWTAKVTGLIEMEVTPNQEISYQLWKPGVIGFTTTASTVPESVGTVTIKIARKNGTSGAVTARVVVDEKATDLLADGLPRYKLNAADLVWAEGDDAEKSVTVAVTNDRRYDGDGKVVLVLEIVSSDGATLGAKAYTLSVFEDDEASPGTVGVVDVEPFFSKAQTVYVKESVGATINIDRLYASDGAASVGVTVSPGGLTVGGLTNGKVSWGNHEADPKAVTIKGLAAGKTAKLTLSNPSKGLKLLTTGSSVTIIAVADTVPEFSNPENAVTLYRYVTTSNVCPLASAPQGKVTFSKIFGTLPSGLKATYDAKANALVIAGATTAKPGDYSVVYQVKDGMTAGLTARYDFTVIDPTDAATNPEGANTTVAKARTFKDVPVFNSVTKRLSGTVQLTVPTKGNVSAKYTCESGTISLSTKGWSEFDPATKELHAALVGKGGFAMDVVCEADGTVDLSISDPMYEDISLDAEALPKSLWTAKASASAWKGYYTVALPVVDDETVDEDTTDFAPRGCGYLTLKMNTSSAWNSGKVAWAGVLPNGTTVSGSTQLTYDPTWAKLPIFKKTATDTLSVCAKILANAADKNEARAVLEADEADACWIHAERDAKAGADYKVELDVFGGLFRTDISLAACCEESYETTSPMLTVRTDTLGSTSLGTPGTVPAATVQVSDKALKLAAGAPAGLTLTVNRNTGIASGAVRIPVDEAGKVISAKWAGVLLQGWGPGCSDCGPGGGVFRPFVNASYFFTDKIAYEVEQGGRTVKKTLSVKRGGELKVE